MNEKCEACGGACCLGILIKPTPEAFEWYAMRGEVEGERVFLECECKYLKLGICSIHETKPQICKDYEVGSEACRNAVKRTGRNFDDL